MVVGEMAEPVDLLIVGAGPGGYVAALRAAELGREVTVVDRADGEGGTGGACLHVGCIPSKALIELADAYHRTQAMTARGLRVPGAIVDMVAFQGWKQSIIDTLAGGVDGLLERHRITRITGDLRFTRPDRAAVATVDGSSRFLEFSQAIVATGSRPAALSVLPVDGERIITSSGALALDTVPSCAAVIGAGYIGLELGTALAKLGATVTVVEACDRILPAVDEPLTRPVARNLDKLGVNVLLSSQAVGTDDRHLIIKRPGGEQRVPAEKVIVAVGRQPNTDQTGLDRLGVTVDSAGLVPVDERRLVTSRIAAIGDITSGPALAHKASAEACVAAEALCGRPTAFDPMAIPAVIFTDPEIATVGLTEAEARHAGLDVAVRSSGAAANGRAATLGAGDGFTRLVVDRGTDRVVGAQIVGPHASELIAEAALAIEMMASPTDLFTTIHPHPTLGEGLHAAAEAVLRAAPTSQGSQK